MSVHQTKDPNSIPESLRRQLDAFRRQLWKRKVIESIAMGLIGLLVSFLLIFGLDRIWQTPVWVRLGILVSGSSLFVFFAPYWLHRWVWGHRQEDQLARLIAKKFPGLGDRLLGVIELQSQHENSDSLSPRLRAAAMQVVALEAEKREFDKALPVPNHFKWGLAALGLVLIVCAAFVITPKAGLNALERWLNPFSKTERYTFTQLDKPLTYLAVPKGEAFAINLQLSKNSEQVPSSALARFESQPELTVALRKNRYEFRFPGQQDKGVITFKIGDLKHSVQIEPMQRPIVTRTNVTVKPPEYLQIPARTLDLNIGEFTAVEGSEISFQLETSRPLSKGNFGPSEVSGEMVKADQFTAVEGALKISGKEVSFGPLSVGNVPFSLPFSWTDEFGLIGGQNFKIRVDAVKDESPVAYTQGIDRQKAILPEEVIDFEILCEDDFGLKKTGIEWDSLGTIPGQETATKGEIIISSEDAEETRINKPVAFSPAAFGIGPQKLMLRAFAEDYFPGRGRVYSQSIVIYVLSREQHAQLLKSQFDRAISELEDLARSETNLLDENQRLEKLDKKELQTEDAQKRLEAQERAEKENTQRMDELTKRMEELMKDTTRNGDIDKETLQKMAETLKSMQELSQKDMPEVSEKLSEAGEASNTEEKSKEDVKQAVEEQKEVVEKMDKALAKARDANKRFEASTFVTRLKKAASEESGIATSLIQKFTRTNSHQSIIGQRLPEVDPKDLRELNSLANQQALTASDVRWIQEDLSHYHVRTGEEIFKKVVDLMMASKIELELQNVHTKLQENRSFMATSAATQWSEKLTEWAKILGDELEKKSSGGGGSGGAPNTEDEDFEFMLRVMKLIQTEQDLRSRTRVLEQLKRDAN